MNGGDNDAYGFGTIDFNALMVETICQQVQLILYLDGYTFGVFILSQKHSDIEKQGMLSFRVFRHFVDIGQVKSGCETKAWRDSEKMSLVVKKQSSIVVLKV